MRRFRLMAVCVLACGFLGGCNSGIFSSAFINATSGGVFPVTPGPEAAFILVRGVNDTNQTVEFIVTIERLVLVRDDDGNPRIDANNEFITTPERSSFRLVTTPGGQANSEGVVLDCSLEPVTLIGLGEDLLPTDAAIFVGGQGAGGVTGFGVPVGDLSPLSLFAGNFNCGDTVIFRAFADRRVAGGVAVGAFLLPGSEQPSGFLGSSTFRNFANFLDSQERTDD